MINCENDFDADSFCYVNVLRKAEFVINQMNIFKTLIFESLIAKNVSVR